jgi:glucose-6-phosphate 1-epimerase
MARLGGRPHLGVIPEARAIEFHGLPAIRWRGPDGAIAIATLQGAHLISWTPPDGQERLFVSERSAFGAGKAIRGGIPVVFPQFAELGPLAKHGFARTSAWTFVGVVETKEGVCASFALEASPQSLALWPHPFRLELAATLGRSRLEVELRVTNTGEEAFAFAAALHTYLNVTEAAAVRLQGLRGTRYRDREPIAVGVEGRSVVTAEEPIDRVYFAAPAELRLEASERVLAIAQRGFSDTVVWNPGRELAAQMADMAPEGYRRMLCVEAASIDPIVTLAAGSAWTGAQAIAVAR